MFSSLDSDHSADWGRLGAFLNDSVSQLQQRDVTDRRHFHLRLYLVLHGDPLRDWQVLHRLAIPSI
jgi:hypothetical protein